MALARKISRPPRRRASGAAKLDIVIPRERESGTRLSPRAASRAARGVERIVATMDVEALRTVASALLIASLGFEIGARRARTSDVVERMTLLAEEIRTLADDAATRVPDGVRKPSTSERMRWEWLASTAALLDGGIEGRIADEANRHLAIAADAASKIDDDALHARVEAVAAMGRVVARASRATLPSNDVAAAS